MNLLLLPIVLPLAAALAAYLLRRRPGVEAAVVLGTMVTVLALTATVFTRVVQGGPITYASGGWTPPIGIGLEADGLSALLATVAALATLTASIQALSDVESKRRRNGHFAFVLVILAGVQGAFLTADLFNLYVWFEVLLAASFGLMAIGRSRGEIEGTIRYMVPNFFGSMLFLGGIGILYGVTGTLQFSQIQAVAGDVPQTSLLAASALLATAFLLKGAMLPFHAWLPASYSTPPPSVTALYGALLGKVGIYALLRVMPLLGSPWGQALIWIGGISMVVAVFAAFGQAMVRRVLTFHIISQMGYAVLAIGIGTPLAYAAAALFLVHNMLAKTALFHVAGILRHQHGTDRLERMGGAHPLIAVLFLVPALALVGFPPSSGFWAKWAFVRAAIDAEAWMLLAAGLFTGVMTLLSMSKIWSEGFWKPSPAPSTSPTPWALWLPSLILALAVLIVGLAPSTFLDVANATAATLGGAP